MNPEKPSREEIEIRLTAMLLGELPEEEARLLRWTISQDPELGKLHDQLKLTIGLVREVSAKPAEPVTLKLSEERRKKLLEHFQTPRAEESFWVKRMRLPSLIEVLAVVAVLAVLAAMLLPTLSRAKYRSRGVAQLAAAKQQEMKAELDREELKEKAPAPPTVTVISGRVRELPTHGVTTEVDSVTVASAPAITPPPVSVPAPQPQIVLPSDSMADVPAETGPQQSVANTPAAAPKTENIVAQTGLPEEPGTTDWVSSNNSIGSVNTPTQSVATAGTSGFVNRYAFQSGSASGISGISGNRGGFGGGGGVGGEKEEIHSWGVDDKRDNRPLAENKPDSATSNDMPVGIPPGPSEGGTTFAKRIDNLADNADLDRLQKTYADQSSDIRDLQAKTDALRRSNGIVTSATRSPYATISEDQLRKYHGEMQAAEEAYKQNLAELQSLQTIAATNKAELPEVIASTIPDQALTSTLDQLHETERQLAKSKVDYSKDNKEVARVQMLHDQLETQVENRVDGIMGGLQANVDAKKSSMEGVAAQLEKQKRQDLEDDLKNQPYLVERRKLEQLQEVHKLLYSKIKAESIDETIPRTSPVQVVDIAQAGKSKSWWESLNGEVESTARVKIENDNTIVQGFTAQSAAPANYDPYFIQTTLEIIQSRAVLDKAVDSLNLQNAWASKNGGQKLTKDEAVAMLKDRLTLSPVKNTKLVAITAKSDQPAESAKLANAVALAYQEYREENSRQMATAGITALKQNYTEEEQRIHALQANVDHLGNSTGGTMEANDAVSLYAKLTGRTVLRSSILEAAPLQVPNLAAESKDEQIATLQRALAAGNLALVNVGNAFVKVVPADTAGAAAAAINDQDDLPLRKPAPNAPIPQPEVLTTANPFSTFAMNVSDVSFQLAAASLEKGVMPEAVSIRSEEFINAFDYRDPEAAAGQPIAFTSERAQDPFAQNRDLLRFSIKTAAAGRQPGRPLNLVLLLDNSGSMERADRVAIIRESLRVLAAQLEAQDTITVVTFARTARLWLDGVPGNQAGAELEKVGSLTPQGGTNLEEAMRLAYEAAHRHYLANGMNRVVLLTDGAANLGSVDANVLTQRVEENRKQGIALDCFGIGWEDFNDDLLEQLSSHGDGRYAFLNSPEQAASDFAAKLAGALQIAAQDVKVQVEFNPDRVTAYRQIGYAKHQLTKEQFRDNSVAAGEIAAAEAGNALYTVELKPDGSGPLATVRLRYRVPGTTEYHERSWNVDYTGNAPALEKSSPAMRLSATAASFAEWLGTSPYAQQITLDELLTELSGVSSVYGADARPKKLEWMIRQAKSLAGK